MLTPIGYICGLSARLEMDAGLSSDDLPRKAPGERGGGGAFKGGVGCSKAGNWCGHKVNGKKTRQKRRVLCQCAWLSAPLTTSYCFYATNCVF